MVSLVVVVLHEPLDLMFQLARQVIMLKLDQVLHGAMVPLDLALCLGMIRSASGILHVVAVEIILELPGEIALTVIGEQPRSVANINFMNAGPLTSNYSG